MKNNILLILFVFFILSCTKKLTPKFPLSLKIPTAGNTWIKHNQKLYLDSTVTNNGIVKWSKNTLRTYFYIHKPTEISIGFNATNYQKNTSLKVSFNGDNKKTFNAIGFGLGNKIDFVQNDFDIVYALDENEWNGNKSIQLLLKDLK